MLNKMSVPLWLIIFLVAIPQLSETIYVPALVDLAESFQINANEAEYTLTIYLLGFGFGSLLWGALSDKIGRKPGFLIGFLFYVIACYGCYITTDITFFYISRFFQAFVGQALDPF